MADLIQQIPVVQLPRGSSGASTSIFFSWHQHKPGTLRSQMPASASLSTWQSLIRELFTSDSFTLFCSKLICTYHDETALPQNRINAWIMRVTEHWFQTVLSLSVPTLSPRIHRDPITSLNLLCHLNFLSQLPLSFTNEVTNYTLLQDHLSGLALHGELFWPWLRPTR